MKERFTLEAAVEDAEWSATHAMDVELLRQEIRDIRVVGETVRVLRS